jgi:hypothetical protein
MRDSRSSSSAIPLVAVALLIAALFLALFPLVPDPRIVVEPCSFGEDCGPPRRITLLNRWRIERECRLFVEQLQRDIEAMEIETEKFRACKKLDGCLGVLKVNDSPQPNPVVGADDSAVGSGDEAD